MRRLRNERKVKIYGKKIRNCGTWMSSGFKHDRRLERQGLMIIINKKKHS